ncbi:unnamed protein product [Rotaria sordida]|uniref:F-box domain-containing protein n=1 Tax=Rotaria sordida TaxID=392033 RepID=A0A813U2K3_9BILA|nr:unnamed protein product [Rotaria sordida]CAF0831533.1 unnamed protein product [Rotaria sordida]
MKNLISNPSVLETFSDEVFFEIFDRLSPIDLYQTFHGLNNRFNTILNDSRMCFRDNISSLNLKEFHSYIENILPKIIDRLVSFTFGTYDTDEYQQVSLFLHTYSIDLSLFKHLRTLVIIKITISDISIIQLALIHLSHLVNIRLSVDSNDVERLSVVNISNNFFIGPRLKYVKMNMCSRTTFNNVNKISNIKQLSIVWCQLQELTHLLQYTPDLYTLKATISGLNDIKEWTEKICGNFTKNYSLRLNSLKLVIDSIPFDHLLLFLHELTQLRSLWLLLNHYEYMNAEKWQNIFQSSLSKVDQLDLTIALMKPFLPEQLLIFSTPYEACEKFNTKFWLDKGWCAKLDEYDHCIRLIVSNNLMPIIKKAKRE